MVNSFVDWTVISLVEIRRFRQVRTDCSERPVADESWARLVTKLPRGISRPLHLVVLKFAERRR